MAADCPPSDIFVAVWTALTDMLGSSATAALVQRGVARAARTHAAASQIVITRAEFEYTYEIPEAWSRPAADADAAMRSVVRELCAVLVPLTGTVVVRRLRAVPLLARCQVIPDEDDVSS
jgi:hypothetical protein